MDKDREKLIYGDGNLVKAKLKFNSIIQNKEVEVPVQFNPREYTITRQIRSSKENKSAIQGKIDSSKEEAGTDGLATMSVRLIFDSATEYPNYRVSNETKQYMDKTTELTTLIKEMSMFTKVFQKDHTRTAVHFIWGSMDFCGHITAMDVNYKLFNRNGMPVKADINLSLTGEDVTIEAEQKAHTLQSPDRTKFRSINQNDELWMLAADEYDDPSKWKEIAAANGILNPRKVDHTKGIKVPAL